MYSINGIGTHLYGKKDIAEDGSYISSKWFIFFLLPIFPIASYRVVRGETTASGIPIILPGATTQYKMIKVPMNWKQIGRTYLLSWGPVILIFGFIVWYLSTYYS